MALSTPTGAGNVTTAQNSSANSITVSKPSNTADGDLLVVAFFHRNAGGTITPPSGWTLVGTLNTTNETFGLYYKAIPSAAAETATTYAFSTSAGSSRVTAVCFRALGVNLSSIADAAGSLAAYTGTTSISLPAVSAVSGYTLLVAMSITNNSTTGSPSLMSAPSGMTKVGEVSADNGSATATVAVFTEVRSVAGSTSTRSIPVSPTASNSGGIMVTFTGIPVSAPAPTVVPDQVVSSVGFNAVPSGTVLAAVSDSSDTTYAESATLTSTDVTFRVGFPELTASPGGVRAKIRMALDVSTTTTTSAKLYQGATLLKTWSGLVPDSLGDFLLTATASDVAGVTDWSALELEITSKI